MMKRRRGSFGVSLLQTRGGKTAGFFVSGDWHRGVRASVHRNLRARWVPRHFTSPDSWCNTPSFLTDKEVAQVAKIAATPLARRGISFLLNEGKMIEFGLFPRLHARFRRCKSFSPFSFFPIFFYRSLHFWLISLSFFSERVQPCLRRTGSFSGQFCCCEPETCRWACERGDSSP